MYRLISILMGEVPPRRLVAHLNTALQLLYPPLMAISVGCILGLDNLLGLGDAAVSLPGIPIP
jgi:hypothetical protein